MFVIPYGAPEGYEWFVTLVVLVCLYFSVRNFMRARRWSRSLRHHPPNASTPLFWTISSLAMAQTVGRTTTPSSAGAPVPSSCTAPFRGRGPLHAEAHGPLVSRSPRNGAARWRSRWQRRTNVWRRITSPCKSTTNNYKTFRGHVYSGKGCYNHPTPTVKP